MCFFYQSWKEYLQDRSDCSSYELVKSHLHGVKLSVDLESGAENLHNQDWDLTNYLSNFFKQTGVSFLPLARDMFQNQLLIPKQ